MNTIKELFDFPSFAWFPLCMNYLLDWFDLPDLFDLHDLPNWLDLLDLLDLLDQSINHLFTNIISDNTFVGMLEGTV